MFSFTHISPLLYQVQEEENHLKSILLVLLCFAPGLAIFFWHVYKAKSWERKLLPLRTKAEHKHILNAFVCATVLVVDADRRDSQTKKALLRHTLGKFDIPAVWIQDTFEKVWKDHVGIKHLAKWMNQQLGADDREVLIYMLVEIALTDGTMTTKEYEIIQELAGKVAISTKQLRSMIAAQNQRKAREEAEANQRDRERQSKSNTSFSSASKRQQAAEILGISSAASANEVKKAYRNLVKKYHPDRFTNQSETALKIAQERFIEIQEAYELLSA